MIETWQAVQALYDIQASGYGEKRCKESALRIAEEALKMQIPEKVEIKAWSPAYCVQALYDIQASGYGEKRCKESALRIAEEALKMQIPEKVEIKAWSPAYCPTCGNELSTHHSMESCILPDVRQRVINSSWRWILYTSYFSGKMSKVRKKTEMVN